MMLDVDWLALCRRASRKVRRALDRFPQTDRALTAGRGMGGDTALMIDRLAEEAILSELEALGVGLTVISEERGEVPLAGGGPVRVVVDPIDGSRNAKRGLPPFAVSIAVAQGALMGDVEFGYVHDLAADEEWWARRGAGAFHDGARLPTLAETGELEMLGLETIHPTLVAAAAKELNETGAVRLRAIGSIALSLCYVAAGRFDGMVSLAVSRSVDTAAGQLVVTEAGGAVAFPEAAIDPLDAPLSLDMRSRVAAASGVELLERLVAVGADQAAPGPA
jgi:myo-inositol-1(or 4)-monophosphatase